MSDAMQSYLTTVAEQIRWKRARSPLTRELESHLLDEYEACRSIGMTEAEAEEEALRQMGDPVTVGLALDEVHRPKPQWGLLCLSMLLVLAGAFLRTWLKMEAGSDFSIAKTLASVLLGTIALFAGYFCDYTRLARHAGWIYGGAVLLGLFSLSYSPILNGISYYTRYITLLFPTVYALLLFRLRNSGWRGLALALLALAPLLTLAEVIPYFFGCFLLLFIGWLLLVIAAWNRFFQPNRTPLLLSLLGAPVLVMGTLLYLLNTRAYPLLRLNYALHPETDPFGVGYLGCVIREALSSAKVWGQGSFSPLYGGEPYWRIVPDGSGTCLLATLVHRFGWLPVLLLCSILLTVLIGAFLLCLRQKHMLGQLLSLSIVLTLGIQAMTNLVYNLGFTLFSASCPFLSGNLSSVLDMALMGLLLSIFRQENLPFSFYPTTHMKFSCFSWRNQLPTPI